MTAALLATELSPPTGLAALPASLVEQMVQAASSLTAGEAGALAGISPKAIVFAEACEAVVVMTAILAIQALVFSMSAVSERSAVHGALIGASAVRTCPKGIDGVFGRLIDFRMTDQRQVTERAEHQHPVTVDLHLRAIVSREGGLEEVLVSALEQMKTLVSLCVIAQVGVAAVRATWLRFLLAY